MMMEPLGFSVLIILIRSLSELAPKLKRIPSKNTKPTKIAQMIPFIIPKGAFSSASSVSSPNYPAN